MPLKNKKFDGCCPDCRRNLDYLDKENRHCAIILWFYCERCMMDVFVNARTDEIETKKMED